MSPHRREPLGSPVAVKGSFAIRPTMLWTAYRRSFWDVLAERTRCITLPIRGGRTSKVH
jgi:hypothetical protein